MMPPKTSWKERHKKKIKLSNDEKTILLTLLETNKHGFTEFETIGRTKEGALYTQADGLTSYGISHYCDNLFREIKNGEEYKISDLLGDEK